MDKGYRFNLIDNDENVIDNTSCDELNFDLARDVFATAGECPDGYSIQYAGCFDEDSGKQLEAGGA